MSLHIFSLGFILYWFHTNLSPHILQQIVPMQYYIQFLLTSLLNDSL